MSEQYDLTELVTHTYPDGTEVVFDLNREQPELSRPFEFTDSSGNEVNILKVTAGYDLSLSGLHYYEKEEYHYICGPLWIENITKDVGTGICGLLIGFVDLEDKIQYHSCPMGELNYTMISTLCNMGFAVQPRSKSKILEYLVPDKSTEKVFVTDKTGWIDHPEVSLSYVFPDYIVGEDQSILYQPSSYSPIQNTLSVSGTLASWNSEVVSRCKGNLYLIFALALSLAAPLLKLLNYEGGAFHFYSPSSKGKTTLGQVAATAWGNGIDPNTDPFNSYMEPWAMTDNGVEAVAVKHNDELLILDEIGNASVSDLGAVIYSLAHGQGKLRLSPSGEGIPPKRWRTLILSTGEHSIKKSIELTSGKKKIKAGQLIRMVDIPVNDNGIICETNNEPLDKFADNLKNACANHFGHAGKMFIQYLVDKMTQDNHFNQHLSNQFNQIHDTYRSPELQSTQLRAAKRFALVELAGYHAIQAGIIDLTMSDFTQASKLMYQQWLGNSDTLSDVDRALINLKNTILANPSKFYKIAEENPPSGRINGYKFEKKNLYLLLPEFFEKAIGSTEPKQVAKELAAQNYLVRNNGANYKSRFEVKHLKQRVDVYAIKNIFLGDVATNDSANA